MNDITKNDNLKGEHAIVANTSCFYEHLKRNISCDKFSCRQWMSASVDNNCAIIGAYHGKKTLQEIGEIFGVTRMRICQIEKAGIQKIKLPDFNLK